MNNLDAQAIAPFLGGRKASDVVEQFEEEGYVTFDALLSAQQIDAVRAALAPYFDLERAGRNNFEGMKSNREYALLAKGDIFADIATHPLALAFSEAEFGPSCLLSAFLAIKLHPGETVQPWHHDDGYSSAPRPRAPLQLSAFWAIDATTETNGATEIIPGSHKWGDDIKPPGANANEGVMDTEMGDLRVDPGAHPDRVKICLAPGALMLAKGTLWHRGGANKSDDPRLVLTPQYCPGWVRPLENMSLSVPKDIAANLPQRARELIGYSIHLPFMGYVDGVHPEKLLHKTA
ncbi:MAG: phytanoyl-CoA dioxygenase family protein [PS1 clade bacterium]|nr:phytanoyl-CoA dioxygenase family protein [PS1 clade bacterium]